MLEFNVLKNVFKKNFLWIASILIFLIIEYVLNYFNSELGSDFLEELQTIPGNEAKFINLYKIGVLVYFIYCLYIYEVNNNYIYIFNRISILKWLVSKISMILLVIVLYNVLYQFLIYMIFSSVVNISFKYLFYSIIFDCGISLLCIFLTNIDVLKNVSPIITIASFIVLYRYFDLVIFLVSIPILLLLIGLEVMKFNTLKKINV